jgi:signal peptidase I
MTSAASAAPAEAKKQTVWGETVEVGKTVFYALAIALVLRILLFQPFTIPSASMEPNLLQGDYIIVSKYSYGYSRHSIPFSPPIFSGRLLDRAPTRGDIIVFKLPRDGHTDYIKRLVGLPGDKIQVRGGVLYINDKPVPRIADGVGQTETPYGPQPAPRMRETLPNGKTYVTYDLSPDGADNTAAYTVPKGCYFMMGDNRDNSLDSRFDPGVETQNRSTSLCPWNPQVDQFVDSQAGVGFVPAENLVGKAQIILLSWYPEAKLFKPWTWFTKARPSRFFKVLH